MFSISKLTDKQFILACLAIVFIGGIIITCEILLLKNPSLVSNIKNNVAFVTTKQPEKFTELYFENHLNLPQRIKKNKIYSFKFTIHNHESVDKNYTYEIYFEKDGKKQIVKESSIFIKDEEYTTIDENFSIDLSKTKAKIVVDLSNNNQQIGFWIEKEANEKI